ncbi:MAG: shikimate dehydrogenase [Microthrixaceae bacterium]
MTSVRGSTKVVGVMGDPIAHSLSPVIHNAAFAALDMDWVCVAMQTPEGLADDAVRGMRAMGIVGMSVTMPHKAAVIGALDSLSDDASALDSVNCISNRDGKLIGLNTDGPGFVAGLRHDFGFEPSGADCVVLGAGGAARSVVLALARAGARSVKVINRSAANAELAAKLAGPVGSVAGPEALATADLVVNATSVGMAGVNPGDPSGAEALPCDPSLLGSTQVVVDLIYNPVETAFMKAAAERGARVSNGVSMLVHQAAVAFEQWTGVSAPIDAMFDATASELSTRG